MRHLTDIESKTQAETFVAYLLTKGISTHVERETPVGTSADRYSIWIREEDRIGETRQELQEFLQNPTAPKYITALDEARAILNDQRRAKIEREKNFHNVRYSRRSPFGGKIPPITLTLIILCIVIGLISDFSTPDKKNTLGVTIVRELMFVDPDVYPSKTQDPAYSLKQFQLWRIVTPAFLHGGPFHLIMNLLSLASLGRITERLEGSGRYVLILLISAMGAHLLQGLLPAQMWGSPMFVGISGVVLGLFGYLAVKSRLQPGLGFTMTRNSYAMVGIIIALGFLSPGGMGLANMAHLGGLITGAVLGWAMNT